MLHRLVKWVLTPWVWGLYRLFGGLRAEGQENIPSTGGAILAPNHLSWTDPPALGMMIPRTCWFMANDFLFRIPVMGKIIPYLRAFPVHRGRLDRDALRTAEEHLKDGDLLCVFPEGGTTITGVLYPFEGGVALLALRNNVPVVPVAITGSDKMLPMKEPYRLHYTPGGIRIRFGKPIHPDEIDPALPRRERVDLFTARLYHAVADLLPPDYLPTERHRYEIETREGMAANASN